LLHCFTWQTTVRSRDVDGCLFQDQLLTVIQVCRRLQLGPGFSQKVFVKTLCKDVRVEVMFLHRPVCLWNCTKGGFCEILGNRHIAYILLDLGFFRPAYCRLLVAFIYIQHAMDVHPFLCRTSFKSIKPEFINVT